MNTESTHTEDGAKLCWDDARDLLDEVRRATDDAEQASLHDFACLVSQVIELQIRAEVDEQESNQIVEFVNRSLDEIRAIFGDDGACSEKDGCSCAAGNRSLG